jgi:hypothetical protein
VTIYNNHRCSLRFKVHVPKLIGYEISVPHWKQRRHKGPHGGSMVSEDLFFCDECGSLAKCLRLRCAIKFVDFNPVIDSCLIKYQTYQLSELCLLRPKLLNRSPRLLSAAQLLCWNYSMKLYIELYIKCPVSLPADPMSRVLRLGFEHFEHLKLTARWGQPCMVWWPAASQWRCTCWSTRWRAPDLCSMTEEQCVLDRRAYWSLLDVGTDSWLTH